MEQYLPLPEDEAQDVAESAAEACAQLNLPQTAAPTTIAQALYEHIGRLRDQDWSEEEAEDHAFLLGALWGDQVVRAMGWEWRAYLPDGTPDATMPAVVSPEGHFAAAPMADVYHLLTDPKTVDSMLLLFNMIVGGGLGRPATGTTLIAGHYTVAPDEDEGPSPPRSTDRSEPGL